MFLPRNVTAQQSLTSPYWTESLKRFREMFEAAATRFLIAEVIALPRGVRHCPQRVPSGTKHFEPSVYCNRLGFYFLNEQHHGIQTQHAAAGIPLTNAALDTMSLNSCMIEKRSTGIRPPRPATRCWLHACSLVTWDLPLNQWADVTPAGSQGRVRVSAAGFVKPGRCVVS